MEIVETSSSIEGEPGWVTNKSWRCSREGKPFLSGEPSACQGDVGLIVCLSDTCAVGIIIWGNGVLDARCCDRPNYCLNVKLVVSIVNLEP